MRRAGTPDVVCFGSDWYSGLDSSLRQIVTVMRRRGSRVLWINPLPIRFPNVRRPDFWRKVQSKARTHARLLARVDDRTWVYSPVYLPLFTPLGWRLNRAAVSAQVAGLRLLLGFRKPLVFAAEFTTWFALPALGRRPLFFHFADKISAFREVSDQPQKRQVLERVERVLVQRSAVAACASAAIHAHVRAVAGPRREGILYLPHGVDLDLFAGTGAAPPPEDIAAVPRPIAGYFGSLTQANDKDLFLAVAKARPDWSFVFIGRVSGDYTALAALPNVHFLGAKPHEQIPLYGRAFDVCFMGWRPHEWIESCSPLKTLEYLALGKPILCSSSITELAHAYPGLVRFAFTAGEFAAALDEELAADSPERAEARRRAVAGRTWDAYVDQVLAELGRPEVRAVG